jgi:hypothetical protein
MATYDVGDQVRVTATFKTAGVLTAIVGATTNATHRLPDGTNKNPDPTITAGSSTGIYYADISLDQVGTHTIKVASTDVVVAAETIELVVTKSIFDHS